MNKFFEHHLTEEPSSRWLRHMSWLLPLLFATMVLLIAAFFYADREKEMNETFASLTAGAQLAAKQIHQDVQEVYSDLAFLSNDANIVRWLKHQDVMAKAAVQKSYLLFSSAKKRYAQIRLLDNDGMELLRIDRIIDRSEIIPDSWLQNKASRYYFSESRDLLKDQVYQSPLDLNVEYGKVEIPFRPMIRFVMPVFDGDDKLGVLILNYNAEATLSALAALGQQHPYELNVLNAEGYYLYSPLLSQNWGFMFEHPNDRLAVQDADIWAKLQATDGKRSFVEDGFAYSVLKLCGSDCNASDAQATYALANHSKDMPWWIIVKLPLSKGHHQLYDKLHFLSATILVLLVFLMYVAATKVLRLAKRMADDKRLLQNENDKFNRILASLPEAIMLVDSSAKIVSVNLPGEELLGISKEKLLNKNIEELMPQMHRWQHQKMRQNFFKEPRRVEVTAMKPYVYARPDADEIFMQIVVKPLSDLDQAFALWIMRDVSQQVEELKCARISESLQTAGEVGKAITRQLDFGVKSIRNLSTRLLERTELPTDVLCDLAQIQKQAWNVLNFEKTFEDAVELPRLKTRSLDLNLWLPRLEERFQALIKNAHANTDAIGFELHMNQDLPMIELPEDACVKAINALILNAAQSMHSAGKVELIVYEKEVWHAGTDQFFYLPFHNGNYVVMEVKDMGIGVSEALFPRLVEPFFTGKDANSPHSHESGQGHIGLGLTYVYQFMAKIGGNVSIFSSVNNGTRVKLYFPFQ